MTAQSKPPGKVFLGLRSSNKDLMALHVKLCMSNIDWREEMITSIVLLRPGTAFSAIRALSICLAIVALGAIDVAKAQNQPRVYSKTDVERLIRDVEESSKDFERDFDTWLDRSPLDGQQREDRYNKQVNNLTSALTGQSALSGVRQTTATPN